MRADEFCMFIHGPFATNIHIDARQVQNLKTVIARRPLSLAEFCILKSLFSSNKQLRTGEDLVKQLKQETKITSSEVYSVLKNLVESTPFVERRTKIMVGSTGNSNAGFLKNLQGSRYAKSVVGTKLLKRFSKDFYSLSQAGKDKLENTLRDKTHKDYFEKINPHSEVDIANASDVTRTALDDFWAEIDAERNIDSYSFSKRAFLDQEEEVSFFSDEDRPVLLAIFPFDDFCRKLSLSNGTEVYLETEKNNIYIYPSGVGVFSSQVTVKYGDDINKIKHELEVKVKKIIQDNFKIQGSQIKLDKFNKSIKYGNRFKLVDVFNLESARVSSPAWTHIIYWFYGNEFSEYDETKGEQKLKSSLVRDFTGLLEQPPDNTLFLQDRFIFYGWGRSLILTDKSDQSTKEWVRNKVNLVEVGQYSCFGHILLDYLLKRVISKLTVEEPIIAQSAKDLEHGTELIDNVRPPATVFLEEYRAGINAILHAGAPFLVKTLEDQWRLSKVEESIKNKLESLNNERSAIEQSTIMQKQDRMNIISSSFTIMGIASVTAAIVALSPLNKWLEEEKSLLPFLSINQVIFFILTTIIIIGLTITIIFKWHDIKRWISHKITSWSYVRKYRNKIKSLDPETIKKEELGLVKREIKNAFNRGKINKSQYYRLQNEIEKAYGT